MNQIFDENSEFTQYMKEQEAKTSSETIKVDSSTENHYVLNLKNHRLEEDPLTEEVPIKIQNKQNLTSSHSSSSASKSTFKEFVFDKLKFIIVSCLIFGITFIVLNWSAYFLIFEGWFNRITQQDLNSPLAMFSSQKQDPSGQDAEYDFSNLQFYANTDIPKLNIEIVPPGIRVVIPRLNTNVPIITMSNNTLISRNWDMLEKEMQNALRDGVVHYPGTPTPNQSGNFVVTGHSSYYPWDPGRFKDVFAILHQAVVNDEIIVFYNQQKYVYKITDIKKVSPTEVNVLGDTGDNRLTLITCTPIGTNLKRLIVIAKPIT